MNFGEENYQRIIYPDVAESLNNYENYKVFLDHWDALGTKLRVEFEVVKSRRESRIFGIYGDQGVGKTLFANRLIADLDSSAADLGRGNLKADRNNLWHRITGGRHLNTTLIQDATNVSVVHKVEGSTEWVKTVASFVGQQKNRMALVIADNAERNYFRQGLVNVSAAEYLQMQNNPLFMQTVAQHLVDACRTKLQRCLLIILSNDKEFMESLRSAVDKQHLGLMALAPLPAPTASDKETIVRVNINRLNQVSYWFCLDKAGPHEKVAVYNALENAYSFREAFKALDNAISCQLCLCQTPRKLARNYLRNYPATSHPIACPVSLTLRTVPCFSCRARVVPIRFSISATSR